MIQSSYFDQGATPRESLDILEKDVIWAVEAQSKVM